jgi:hypothetical protein
MSILSSVKAGKYSFNSLQVQDLIDMGYVLYGSTIHRKSKTWPSKENRNFFYITDRSKTSDVKCCIEYGCMIQGKPHYITLYSKEMVKIVEAIWEEKQEHRRIKLKKKLLKEASKYDSRYVNS